MRSAATLPRLVSLLQLGEPISFGVGNTQLVKMRVEAGAPLDGATALAALRGTPPDTLNVQAGRTDP